MNDTAMPQPTSLFGLLDWLWRILAWPRLTLIVLVWVAVVLALSTVVPQAPPNIEDPIVRSQWLANIPISVRPAVERLQSLGVFDLLDSVWLRLPLALLLAHVLVMLAALGPAIWHRVRRPLSEPISLGKSFRLVRDLSEPVEHVGQQFITRLEKAGYRVSPTQESYGLGQDQGDYIVWRWQWSWLGLAGLYLGLGLASAGLILEAWLGQMQGGNLGPDNPMPLPAIGAPSLVLEGVTVTGNNPLRPASGVALVRTITEVGQSQHLALTLHNSYLLRGMWLTVADLRPVAEATAVDTETGENVLLLPFSSRMPAQERVRLALTGDPETRFVGVPSQNVTLRVDYQADVEYPPSTPGAQDEDQHPGPVFFLSFFRGAESTPSQSVSLPSGDEVTFDGVRYLISLDYDVMLRISSTLWWVVIALGWGLAALSLVVLVIAPPVYVRGSVQAAVTGSRVTLTADVLGDEQRRQRELSALITPDD